MSRSFAHGEVPEWSNGAVSKTVDRVTRSVGSNPTLSAISPQQQPKVDRREAHLSTQQSSPQEEPRFPGPHANASGPGHSGSAPAQGPYPSERLVMDRHALPSGGQCRHQRLRRQHRLRRRADYLRCYRQGRKRHGNLATLHYHPNDEPEARLGITASRKVGKAVRRQKAKRRIREIFRRWNGRFSLPPLDIVVHLRPEAGRAEFKALEAELHHLLAQLVAADRRGAGRWRRAAGEAR
jgi:ribonuclease P protein component